MKNYRINKKNSFYKNRIFNYLFSLILAIAVTICFLPGCEDTGLVDIYNSYTETYRKSDEQKLFKDSCISLKILNSYTNLPINGAALTLISPVNDTVYAETDTDGIAIFKLFEIITGDYTINAVYTLNSKTYYANYKYSLYNKNIHAAAVYFPVKELK